MLRSLVSASKRVNASHFQSSRIEGLRAGGQVRSLSNVITLTDESVSKFIDGSDRAVLYYTATWCPPCKVIKPIYEELSGKFEKVSFGKVDVDDCPDAAVEANIRSVPTFVFFKDGEPVKEFAGADQKMLQQSLEELSS